MKPQRGIDGPTSDAMIGKIRRGRKPSGHRFRSRRLPGEDVLETACDIDAELAVGVIGRPGDRSIFCAAF
jgi:hypothetical protein